MTQLRDIEIDPYLHDSVVIVPEAIQEEYVRVAPDLAYWNAKYAEAYAEHARSKVALSRLEALLRIKHREAIIANAGKPTESMVDASVAGDPDFQYAQDRLVEADIVRVQMLGNVDAVRAKREMLVSVGAHIRAEMGGDPSIRNQAAASKKYG